MWQRPGASSNSCRRPSRQQPGYREPRGRTFGHAPVSFGEEFALPSSSSSSKRPGVDMRILFADRNVNLVEEQIHVALRLGILEDPTLVATKVG